MTQPNLLKSRIAQSTTGRYHSFIAAMIEVGLPHSVAFFNGLIRSTNVRDEDLLRIVNRYGHIAFPSCGSISPMYRVHRSLEFGLLVDITLSEIRAEQDDGRRRLYRTCVPSSAQSLLQLNGIENEVLEGMLAARY